MTLVLKNGIQIKTLFGDTVYMNVPKNIVDTTMDDFLAAAYYILTNSELMGPYDPRRRFIDVVKELKEGPGFGDPPRGTRYIYKTPAQTFSLIYPR